MSNRQDALALRLSGLSYQQIGTQLGISRQRVQQLVSPPPSVRRYVVHRAEGRCQQCSVMVGTSGHVHHRDSRGTTENNFNDLSNLQLLCITCHRTAHYGDGPLYSCLACNHEWRGLPAALESGRTKPASCPHCLSRKWNSPASDPPVFNTCTQCGNQWTGRKPTMSRPKPVACPNCTSRHWDSPRVERSE